MRKKGTEKKALITRFFLHLSPRGFLHNPQNFAQKKKGTEKKALITKYKKKKVDKK